MCDHDVIAEVLEHDETVPARDEEVLVQSHVPGVEDGYLPEVVGVNHGQSEVEVESDHVRRQAAVQTDKVLQVHEKRVVYVVAGLLIEQEQSINDLSHISLVYSFYIRERSGCLIGLVRRR